MMSDIETRVRQLEQELQRIHDILEERRKAYASLVNGVSNRLLVLEAKCEPCLPPKDGNETEH